MFARTRMESEAACRITQFYGVEEGIIVIVITVLLVIRGGREMTVGYPRGRSEFGPIPSLPAFDEGNMLW